MIGPHLGPALVVSLALALLTFPRTSEGSSKMKKGGPTPVSIGKSMGGYSLGMPLSEARLRSSAGLRPEGVQRVGKTGYTTGPILLLVDDATNKVVQLSLELRISRGVRIGKVLVPATATLPEIQKLLPRCKLGKGSGGNTLACETKEGTLHAYDSFSSEEVWLMIP